MLSFGIGLEITLLWASTSGGLPLSCGKRKVSSACVCTVEDSLELSAVSLPTEDYFSLTPEHLAGCLAV